MILGRGSPPDAAPGSGVLQTPYKVSSLRPVDSRLSAIRDRIALLAAIDRDRQVFGAANHHFAFASRLSETELAGVEARYGELPDEYRALVATLGAPAAGPYYGLLSPEPPEHADPTRELGAVSPLDGTIVLAEQGCGGRSLLVIRGAHRGEVWSDWTREEGTLTPEAKSVYAWYEAWLDRAMLEWVDRAAPRIALEGPDDPSELEAISEAFELVAKSAGSDPALLRTLGYLHLRERRYGDASAAFAAAAAGGGDEPIARGHLDRARLDLTRGARDEAIMHAERGLACEGLWYSTRDELRDTLERALGAAGRANEALAVLDLRAAECQFSLALHHRLARERIARGDLAGAGAALERAAAMQSILGTTSSIDDRLSASFEPIIRELAGARRLHEVKVLTALVERIRGAN